MPWELINKNLIQLPEDAKFNFSKIKELVLKYKAEIFFDQGKQYILRIKPDRKHQDIGLELHLLGFQYDVYTESFNYSWEKHENVAELNELIAFFNAEKTEEEIKFYLSKKIHLFIKELNYGHPGVIFLFLKACKIGIIKLQNYDLDWYKSLVKAVQNRSISAALELELDENIDVGIRYFFKLARIKLEEKYNKEEDTLGCYLCVKLNENHNQLINSKIRWFGLYKLSYEVDAFLDRNVIPNGIKNWLENEENQWYYPCVFCEEEQDTEGDFYKHLKIAHKLSDDKLLVKKEILNKTYLDYINPDADYSNVWFGKEYYLKLSVINDLNKNEHLLNTYKNEFNKIQTSQLVKFNTILCSYEFEAYDYIFYYLLYTRLIILRLGLLKKNQIISEYKNISIVFYDETEVVNMKYYFYEKISIDLVLFLMTSSKIRNILISLVNKINSFEDVVSKGELFTVLFPYVGCYYDKNEIIFDINNKFENSTLKVKSDSKGNIYIGGVEDDISSGFGLSIKDDGIYSSGFWENGALHGVSYIHMEGDDFDEGNSYWRNGEYINYLKYIVNNELQKKYGKKNRILFSNDNGTTYSAEFIGGKYRGNGNIIFENNDKYIGEFENYSRHGNGICIYEELGKYTGQWFNDKRHGQGVMIFYDFNNEYDINAEGDVYQGEWFDDEINGFGTYTWQDGEKYIGSWIKGLRSGKGTQYDSDGLVLSEGYWSEDNFKEDLKIETNIILENKLSKEKQPDISDNLDEQIARNILNKKERFFK